MQKWQKFSKLARPAPPRIHIHLLNVSVCRYTVVYIQPQTISNKRKLRWLSMYADVLWHLQFNMFLRQSIWSIPTQILKVIAVFNVKILKFSKLARINIHCLNIIVLSIYRRLYIASYHRDKMKMHWLCIYVCKCYLRPKNLCVSKTK